jgi:RNA polymerase sigma-70 factor, ECF subfamily
MSERQAIGAANFEPHRRALTGLAYRMLGSVTDAQDIVQDAYLRWHRIDPSTIADPRAWLIRTVTRLCLDELKSARVRRETYVGPWLPEPVADTQALTADTESNLADDVSVALLLALERLSPLERAAFLLHDVFEQDFSLIGAALNRTPAACRQLATRARTHIRASPPRFRASAEDAARLVGAFMQAAIANDVAGLTAMLADDAELYSDGGGIRIAALNVIRGNDRVARFVAGVARKSGQLMHATPVELNGLPGFLLHEADGTVRTLAFDIGNGQIQTVYIVANPQKLRHLERPSA